MEKLWEEIKKEFCLELPKNSFTLWISPITFLKTKDHTIVLGCPNKFSRSWVLDNYSGKIREKFRKAGLADYHLAIKVTPPKKSPPPSPLDDSQLSLPNIPASPQNGRIRLNAGFTFDRFVVGRGNEFAYSASRALAHGNPLEYPCLLMLAKTGLGKTHLSQAVGHAILQQNPQSRVYYVTAEDFTNEMISSLRNNCIEAFKNRYRRACDVLLLEEIHFLSGKEKTQLELGHTLDALAHANKKIIFTSAIPPQDLPRMSKELSSRLTAGLVMTIDKPDFNTRLRILRKKSAEQGLRLPEEIAQYLASHLKRDVRQIESALSCLRAKSELLKEKIDLNLAKEVVHTLVSTEYTVTPGDVKDLVCKYYKLDPEALRSRSRKKTLACPRYIYIYLCRKYTDETLERIAQSIERSHSTVLYALEVAQKKMKADPKTKRQVEFLSRKLEEMKR